MGKRGTILIKNIILIILNLVFLSTIILFLSRQSSGAYLLEETYAKQIALIADYAKPEMIIKIDMEKGMEIADENKYDFYNAVKIKDNIVYVNLRENGGYSYSFFNDVHIEAYPDRDNEGYNGLYILTITKDEND